MNRIPLYYTRTIRTAAGSNTAMLRTTLRRTLLSSSSRHDLTSNTASNLPSSKTIRSLSSSSSGSISSTNDLDSLIHFKTLVEMQMNACETYGRNPLFGTYDAELEEFLWMDYETFGVKVEKTRSVLSDELGVKPLDKVGIISNNRWEWAAVAAATYSMNATLVPMYEAQLPKDWTYILNDSGCSALLCASQDIYDKVMEECIMNVPSLSKHSVLCFDSDSSSSREHIFSTLLDKAKPVSKLNNLPNPDDLANLVYTSGTTGVPKGVELTHDNSISNIYGVRSMVKNPADLVRQSDRSLSFLPWAHSYGQTCELWCFMSHGASLGICRGVPSILEDLQLVKPTALFSVPTLYKRIFDGVNNMLANTNPIRRGLMKKALQLGKERVIAQNEGSSLGFWKQKQFNVLDGIVLQKIRDRFGSNLRHGFVAGAACPKEILDFMDSIGIEVYEGYGLTETSPIICINSPEKRKVGSVGYPLGGVTAAVLDESGNLLGPNEEGEICCYGPNVMRGYYGKPNETNEVLSIAPDGKSRLFHTGDLGRICEDGFIYVTGRIKEQYKLENGKYVCPTPVEEAIGMSRFIQQTVLVGANRPYNVALIVPDWVAIRAHLKVHESEPEEELVNDPKLCELLDSEIQANCLQAKIKKFEIPKTWSIVAPFTVANNMLTPKMSIRRHMVVKVYDDVIAQMCGDDSSSEQNLSKQAAA
mmetsp:Transcript_15551/g.20281  ORF Transcript_15551/g.20281 Transcript_15551/m.20281 type:complete len:702 (+) Transcript_15551:195-2300(+)